MRGVRCTKVAYSSPASSTENPPSHARVHLLFNKTRGRTCIPRSHTYTHTLAQAPCGFHRQSRPPLRYVWKRAGRRTYPRPVSFCPHPSVLAPHVFIAADETSVLAGRRSERMRVCVLRVSLLLRLWIFVTAEATSAVPSSLYNILEVQASASAADIKRAYRKLALVWHPDRVALSNDSSVTEAEARFRELTHAYEVLTDPDSRAAYDRGDLTPDASQRAADKTVDVRSQQHFNAGASWRWSATPQQPVAPIQTYVVNMTLEQVVVGGVSVTATVLRKKRCSACHGGAVSRVPHEGVHCNQAVCHLPRYRPHICRTHAKLDDDCGDTARTRICRCVQGCRL
ncbi:J domain-containing protein [archaeon]|nr:MAG: J domain-containing protein [archaeon]